MSSRHVWPGLSHLLSQGRKSLSFSPRSPPINPDRLALDVADLEDGFGAKGLDAAGDDDPSATMVFTQLVIKRANAVSSEVMMVSIPKAARRSRCPRSAAAVASPFRFLTF